MEKHEETYQRLAFNITYYRKKARFTQMQLTEKSKSAAPI